MTEPYRLWIVNGISRKDEPGLTTLGGIVFMTEARTEAEAVGKAQLWFSSAEHNRSIDKLWANDITDRARELQALIEELNQCPKNK